MNKPWVYRIIGLIFFFGGAFAAAYGPTQGLPAWPGLTALFVGSFIFSFPQLLATPQPQRTQLLLAEGCVLVLAVSVLLLPAPFFWLCLGGMGLIGIYVSWVQKRASARVKREDA
jgi:hypothetical protein